MATANAAGGLKMPPLPPSLPPITPTPMPVPDVTPMPMVTPAPAEMPGPSVLIPQPSLTTLLPSTPGTNSVSMDMFYQRLASRPVAADDPVLATTGREADLVGIHQSNRTVNDNSTGIMTSGDSNLSRSSDALQITNNQSTFIQAAGSWIDQFVAFLAGGR